MVSHVKTRKAILAHPHVVTPDQVWAVGKALQSGDMMLETLSLPKYQDWAHYDDWLGMNGARVMLELMMGY